ncbi:hypothetical protein [Natronospora cellulosivora (SeqCode)]
MIVVRFREGKDDDLKKWYEGLPEGERSRIVRKILKNNINITNPKVSLKRIANCQKKSNINQKINNIIENL